MDVESAAQNAGGRPAANKVRYQHALALYPYPAATTAWMGVFPPTGLEYIAASLEGLVGKVTFLDLRFDSEYRDMDSLCEFIRREIDLVCVSIPWSAGFDRVCDLVKRLPASVTTVLGGYKATEDVEDLFRRCPNVGLIVRGEGEKVIQQIATGVPLPEIAGLSYREKGRVIHNANAPLPDVADIHFPDRSLRRHEYRWIQHGIKLVDHTFDAVLTARGCPFKCKFCTFSLNPLGQKREYTERPLESVMEELQDVTADIVMFSDDNFFTNPRRSEKLCDLIIASGIKKMFAVQARIDVAKHPALLEKAFRAGIRLMSIGIESPHDRILAQINKGFTQQEVRDAFKVLRTHPFYLHAYFIYGNIGETEEEMLYIPRFAKELGVDSISFQKLRIEKHSPLKELVESTPGYHFNHIGGPVYSDRYDLAALKRIRNRIRSEFYDFARLRQIVGKFRSLGVFSKTDVARLILNLPRFLYALARKKKQKRARRMAARSGIA